MAAINSGSNNSNNNNTSAGGSNMYRVGDYVYFEAQQQQQPQQQQQSVHHHQQQPFQIRRIEELNKTAGGNVEAKVMCFYRRRDLPAQLVALADKHQQHQQQQQLSLALSLSPGGSSAIKGGGKQSSAIKSSSVNDKDATIDKKEQETGTSGALAMVKKEQQNEEQSGSKLETIEINETVKEEQQQQLKVEMSEEMEINSAESPLVNSKDVDEGETNDKSSDVVKDEDKTTQATQPQYDWWRGEQLKQRELFLSRQVETLAATHIRGKCTVTLYNETESLDSYLEREDTFFYCLVFDPVQKTLLADKGEIRVGHKYQAEVPPKALFNRGSSDVKTKDITATMIKGEIVKENTTDGNEEEPMITECSREDDDDDKDVDAKSSTAVTTVTAIGTVTAVTVESDSDLETLIWTCRPQWNRLTDRQIDQFLVVSRSLGTFARALDCTSSVKQPSLHMSAAAASRDITLFHAMDTLHRHAYDLGTATCSLVPSTGPVLCRDEMEEWSASEANLFEEALEKYGKDFGDIRHDFLPWKTHKNIVEYYYMWKTTDRYVQQKRVKAVEQESKLKQVYIPSYNGTTSGGKQQAITSGVTIKSSQQQQQLVNGNSAAVELYSPKNSSGGLSIIGEGPLLPGICDLCDVVSSQQWYPNSIGTTTGTTAISYHQQNGGLSSTASSTLCHECWTHWKKYGGPRTATSDKKVIAAARGESMSGDEDRPHSNASSSSLAAAMNLNTSASGGRSLSHGQTVSTPPHHHHHLMHLGGSGSSHHSSYHHQSQHHHHQQLHHQQQQQQQQQHQQQQQQPSSASSLSGGGLLLHQPHINSSGSTTTAHRCTIIGCQAAPFKSKSQLLRHYSTAHGIGINSNSSSSPGAIITSIGGSSRSSGSGGIDGGGSGTLSPQPQQQQQTVSGTGHLHHNSGGALNLNSSNPIQHSISSGSANQVINLIASSSSPQQQPNNLSTSGGAITTTTVIGTGGVSTATGRPIMKTRTAFYLRCTSLAKASRRRSAQQATAALLQQQHLQKKSLSSGTQTTSVLSPIASALVQPGCLARPRNVARRPFICVPQTAHAYKHECMLSMQHAPVHELRAYLRAAAVKAHARRPGVTRVANALIAARRNRGGMSSAIAADLAVPDWLSLPSQQHQHQSSHHHVSSSSAGSKHSKHSSRSSTGGRVAFPKPPKAPDGSLLYERVPNKHDVAASGLSNPSAAAAAAAAAVGLNPATAAAILGALGPPGSGSGGSSAGASGSSNEPPATGFDVAAAAAVLYQQQQQQQHQHQQLQQGSSSSSNKRRLYETDNASIQQQPQPQAGPPSKRMHRQQHHSQQQQSTGHHHQSQQHQQPSSTPQGGSGAGGGAVDGMLASIVAHQQQQQQQRGSTSSGGPLQLTATGSGGKSGGLVGHQQPQQQHQQHNHYRTPSMARTGRKHVISWTDAPDDLYYRCTTLSRSLRKARMTGKELRRSARKPWQPIAALLGISFTMPSAAASSSATPLGTAGTTGSPAPQSSSISVNPSTIGSATPFDMSTTGGGAGSSNRQPSAMSNQSVAPIVVAPCISGSVTMSSRTSGGGSSHH